MVLPFSLPFAVGDLQVFFVTLQKGGSLPVKPFAPKRQLVSWLRGRWTAQSLNRPIQQVCRSPLQQKNCHRVRAQLQHGFADSTGPLFKPPFLINVRPVSG